jgi:3D (Asp-Asp-Asp) domain-containing protein
LTGWPRTALVLAAVVTTACADLRGQAALDGGEEVDFKVTAYCSGRITKSGARVREGMAASDPRVLPVGSTVRVDGSGDWDGVYTVMDTGGKVRGRHLDLYLKDCDEARELGRREMGVRVIRKGWDPSATPEPDEERAAR